MEEQFVPYELALKLKELGFNEECFGFYNHKNNLVYNDNSLSFLEYFKERSDTNIIPAPLWQQSFNFFMEKYSLIGYPCHYGGLDYPNMVCNYKISGKTPNGQPILGHTYDTYKEARLACLEKLIELIS